MRIKELKLKNYRNIKNICLNLNKQKVLIIGKNAQGKTNILESIYFISSLKTPRTTNIMELINIEKEKVEIKTEIEKNNVLIELEFNYDIEKKRELKINGLKTTPKTQKSVLKTVLFSTQDLLLLRGAPEDRRNWLDSAISQIYPAYDERLTKYNKIRSQKNNYLKEFNNDDTLLDVFNEQLVILGSNIIFLRKKFIKELEKIAQEKHSSISQKEELKINYVCNFLKEENNDIEVEEIAKLFKQKQEERKADEIKRGQTLVGPHRDDIAFYINKLEAIKYASQGQQRTIVLSLKMAELDIITQKTGEPPILLLDDVLAELDDIRQTYLLKTIDKNTQTIITCVDTILFDSKFLEDVLIYKIENGKIL